MPTTLKKISKRIANCENQVKLIRERQKFQYSRDSLKLGNTDIFLRKCISCPSCEQWKNKTVLADSTWRYIEIFLKSKQAKEALFYWYQARDFFEASLKLSLISAPLTAYYSLLNATKALLKYKNVLSGEYHGVTGTCAPGRVHLQNEIVEFKLEETS
jgi:hypothetical protein